MVNFRLLLNGRVRQLGGLVCPSHCCTSYSVAPATSFQSRLMLRVPDVPVNPVGVGRLDPPVAPSPVDGCGVGVAVRDAWPGAPPPPEGEGGCAVGVFSVISCASAGPCDATSAQPSSNIATAAIASGRAMLRGPGSCLLSPPLKCPKSPYWN